MKFLYMLREKFARFMIGRNGTDEIVHASFGAWLALYSLGLLTGSGVVMLLAEVCIIYALFRMSSKNVAKRRAECAVFRIKTAPLKKRVLEYVAMFKNRKKYAYFSCPQCKAKLRVPRGVGNVTITCRQCGNKFDKKA